MNYFSAGSAIHELMTCFPVTPAPDSIPSVMPSPFSNTPHPLAKQASLMLMQRLTTQTGWPRDFFAPGGGKMFGVLVVRAIDGTTGYLSAFSGMINGKWHLPGFVPELFNLAEHQSFLSAGNDQLALLTEQLQNLETSAQRYDMTQQLTLLQQQRDVALAEIKQRHRLAKATRKQQRQIVLLITDTAEREAEMAALALASQHHKREATNAMLHWQEKLQVVQQQLDLFEQQISQIKELRTEKSRQLHKSFFATYVLHNHLHEQQPITDFFEGLPPAGAGDCAGPKLLHHAHQHRLQPLALAEFWWGSPPSSGIRHHGQFYPACRGKCRPILPFMLRGLNVEAEPDYGLAIEAGEPQIIYEDESLLVVNKPAGLMSAPGKHVKDSVFTRLLQDHPDCPELRLVHRLDMATSGLLLVAKNLSINKLLQRQFVERSVEKRYEALLSKPLSPELTAGEINLPLRVDFDDRPRQLVCYEYGKSAITRWQVIGHEGETTRIWFYPHTGRTHQLRMHASHRDGLNAAIVGDALYGEAGVRLMLHAQRLCFTHPLSHERLEFEVPAPF